MKLLLPLLLLPVLFIGMAMKKDKAPSELGYNFEQPLLLVNLPKNLQEISGLSLDGSGQYLLAVQDEKGKVFYLDRQSGEVVKEITFWDDDDYEGIEAVGDDIYVLKSSGTLYQIRHAGTPHQTVEKYNGFLNGENDVEGLGYDARHNRLLLACKTVGGEGFDKNKERVVFGFDLKTKTFDSKPVYIITRDVIKTYLKNCPRSEDYGKLCEFFIDRQEYDLGPSAIAVHPQTGDLYLSSSVGKVVLVMSPTGQIRHIERLPKDEFPQPEGLCFDRGGTLYVSTEGKDGPGAIYRFPYQLRGQ